MATRAALSCQQNREQLDMMLLEEGGQMYELGYLVAAGALVPGRNLLGCTVGGADYYADLGNHGEIYFQQQMYGAPSGFLSAARALTNPEREDRMYEDAWSAVRYRGEPLHLYRESLKPSVPDRDMKPTAGGQSSALTTSPLRSSLLSRPRKAAAKRGRNGADGSYESSVATHDGHDSDFGSVGPNLPSRRAHVDEDEDYPRQVKHQRHASVRPPALVTSNEPFVGHNSCHETRCTWINCEEKGCNKWRKVDLGYARQRPKPWACHMNPDSAYNRCDIPQQASLEHVLEFLSHRHTQECRRPPLHLMKEEEFIADLLKFYGERNETELAKQISNRRVTCNNVALDIFNLYKEVMLRGGFKANEDYDQQGRWKGRINFAGEIFKKLNNYTENNKATSVGNQLMMNYKKFLLQYEKAHLSMDLPANQQPQRSGGTEALDLLVKVSVHGVDDAHTPVESHPRTASARAVRRPKRWEEETVPERRPRTRTSRDAHTPSVAPYPPLAQKFNVYSLYLAVDPSAPAQYWPVFLINALGDLPESVTPDRPYHSPRSIHFPLADHHPSVESRDLCPVMVVGTGALGWVESFGMSREFNPDRGQSALNSAASRLNAEGDPSEKEVNETRYRSLKQAFLFYNTGDNRTAVAKSLVEAAGVSAVAESALALQGRLPFSETPDFKTWQDWESDVKKCETASQLARQITFLMHNTLLFVHGDKQAQLHEQVSPLLGTAVSVRNLDKAVALLRSAAQAMGEPQPAPSAGYISPALTEPVQPTLTSHTGVHLPHSASVNNLVSRMAVGRRSVRHTRPSGVPGVPRSHGTPEPRRGTSPLTFGTSTPAQPAGHVEEDRVSELTPRSRATTQGIEDEVVNSTMFEVGRPPTNLRPIAIAPQDQVELKPAGQPADNTPVFSRMGAPTHGAFHVVREGPSGHDAPWSPMDNLSRIPVKELESGENIVTGDRASSGTGSADNPVPIINCAEPCEGSPNPGCKDVSLGPVPPESPMPNTSLHKVF